MFWLNMKFSRFFEPEYTAEKMQQASEAHSQLLSTIMTPSKSLWSFIFLVPMLNGKLETLVCLIQQTAGTHDYDFVGITNCVYRINLMNWICVLLRASITMSSVNKNLELLDPSSFQPAFETIYKINSIFLMKCLIETTCSSCLHMINCDVMMCRHKECLLNACKGSAGDIQAFICGSPLLCDVLQN